ncbi:MAG: hypothetical protein Unbinned6805contig1000_38 [Prokaryotic dsDNA virus sp.]|nr:MAG: hypothetical protein Unbinned6805contig1000_38 [Prokaryotic dsDNA virus sp.]|tara:strand:+ start:37217 stop:37702 length:486 start_codon:yes stop_codon:yes gene_type:complete
MDKSKFKDSQGRFLTQSLFLEQAYDVDTAVYTLKDEDFTYKGVEFPSLKKLYLAMEDPIEYDFANTYLAGWNQWERIAKNKLYVDMVSGWRKELELKLRSKGFKQMMNKSKTSPMAARWLSDKGWDDGNKKPTKASKEEEKSILRQVRNQYTEDLERLRIN